MYCNPVLLKDQYFIIRGKAAATLSYAETELVRAEEHILASPNAKAVKRALLRFETLMSSRVVTGRKIELQSLLRLEAATQLYPYNERNNELLESLIVSEGLGDEVGLLEAFRYMQTIEWLSKVIRTDSEVLPKTILNIHSRCLYGLLCRHNAVDFRSTSYTFPLHEAQTCLYRAPDPADIPAFIEDYCEFVNNDVLNPSAQAGISHFQIESIRPFEDRLDGTERALSHLIFFKRGLLRSTIAPLALGPARDTEAHARYFVPHQVGYLVENVSDYINSGVIFSLCAYYTKISAQAMSHYLHAMTKLETHWRECVGKIEKGSTVDLLLQELSGMPMVSVNSASKIVGRSFSATNDALCRLQKVGILEKVRPVHKNNAFVAHEAVEIFRAIDSKFISRNPVARDDILFIEN